MKKLNAFFAGLLAVIIVFCITANAEDAFNVENYSLEELKSIKESVDSRIAELEREWAIEHGNRTITFDFAELTLFVKQKQKVSPIVTRILDDAPANTSIIWSSSNPGIASVSSDGTVSAIAYGDAFITATAKDNDCIMGSFSVHVVLPVSKISIKEKELTLLLNNQPADAEADLHINYEPQNAYASSLIWKSSKDSIVTVDEKGHVKGLKPGSATVTATVSESMNSSGAAKKASININVVQAVTKIKLSDTSLVIDKGKTKKIKAQVVPDNATKKSVSFSSSNTAVASISSEGLITAKGCGECTITCSANDGSGIIEKCHVTVKQLIASIKPSETKIILSPNHSKNISLSISPADATNKTFSWESSNSTVAVVNDLGKITAKSCGDCIITCKAKDGSEKQAAISVHVPMFNVAKTEYTVTDKKGLSIPVEDYSFFQQLTASSDSSCFDFEWSGNNLVIDPIKAGTGTIKITSNKTDQDVVTLKIRIDHSAVYDTSSYPQASYKDILRYPNSYKGDSVHIYGKVLQKVVNGSKTILRVGTSGYGHSSSVFWVEYNTNTIKTSVIEDDFVTVFGKCTGAYTYTSTWNQSITIPSMEAEKIIIGRK